MVVSVLGSLKLLVILYIPAMISQVNDTVRQSQFYIISVRKRWRTNAFKMVNCKVNVKQEIHITYTHTHTQRD